MLKPFCEDSPVQLRTNGGMLQRESFEDGGSVVRGEAILPDHTRRSAAGVQHEGGRHRQVQILYQKRLE